MSELHDIERLIREARPPDQDPSTFRQDLWQQILKARSKRRRSTLITKVAPWIWALASILMILLCIYFMMLMGKE